MACATTKLKEKVTTNILSKGKTTCLIKKYIVQWPVIIMNRKVKLHLCFCNMQKHDKMVLKTFLYQVLGIGKTSERILHTVVFIDHPFYNEIKINVNVGNC